MGCTPKGTMLALAPVLRPSAKADMAHPSLVWMPAKMRDSSSRAYKSLKTSPKLSLAGFFLLVLDPLTGTKAALMLSLCALPQLGVLRKRRFLVEAGLWIIVAKGLFFPGREEHESSSGSCVENGGEDSMSQGLGHVSILAMNGMVET
eukprot:1142451-Pelagomonas_calceolata.AAC.1